MSMWEKLFGRKSPATSDSPELIQQNIANGQAVMLDVRGQEERDAGFLKDSIFIPISDIKELTSDPLELAKTILKDLPKDKIVYCH